MDEEQKAEFFDTDKLCLRCGRCCHGKEIVHGKVVFTKDECPNLVNDEHERGKKACKIYGNHLNQIIEVGGKTVRCIPSEQAFKLGVLPPDCPYVYYYTKGADAKLKSFLIFQEAVEKQDWEGIAPKPEKIDVLDLINVVGILYPSQRGSGNQLSEFPFPARESFAQGIPLFTTSNPNLALLGLADLGQDD